jgi:hypothetical protein
MSKFKKVLTNIFIESDEEVVEKPKTPQVKETVDNTIKIPTNIIIPTVNVVKQEITENVVVDNTTVNLEDEKVLKTFEEYFEKINKPGYDFFEFYKAVNQFEDVNSYKTAFSVVSSFDSTISKDNLLKDHEYYINNVNLTVEQLKEQSSSRISQLVEEKDTKTKEINDKIDDCYKKLVSLQNEYDLLVKSKPDLLNKYDTEITQVENRMKSVYYYQNKFLSSFNKVKNNIINFL